MRYKIVPPARGLDVLEAVHDALPLVPGSVEDCCIRAVDRTAVTSRDNAREWITFLQALELAEETSRGFKRVRADIDRDSLANAFQRRIFGADHLLSALKSAESLTVDEAFDRLKAEIPQWERDRHTDWEGKWRERTERLLDWSVTFGLATRDGDTYRSTERTSQ